MASATGAFFPPTVLTDITPDNERREELFGPVAAVYKVGSEDEAVKLANDTPYGLGSYVFTEDEDQALRIADKLDTGMVFVNLVGADGAELPFGGKYGDEFKVMGLAPYGEPSYVRKLETLVRLQDGGHFELDLSYFRHVTDGVQMTWADGEPTIGPVYSAKLETLLGAPRRSDEALEPRHEAIAASLQAVFERAAFHVLRHVRKNTGRTRLCLAGGCAMNSVANGKIREQTGFREVFIQPAAGDNGTALGAAFHAWHASGNRPRAFVMQHSLWGPSSDNSAIAEALDAQRSVIATDDFTRREWRDQSALDEWTAVQIAAGRVVGWFQGRMEWGARALGNRSIVADPRRADMREIINTRIKFRERFRPFAPSVLEEVLDEFFVRAVPDPFMLQVYPVRPDKRTMVPAITHVDGSGRLQTVSAKSNRRYYDLIRAFQRLTGVGMLLNTSFNENEPIVHTPAQALDCFLRTSMDVLVMGNHSVERPHAERR